MNSDLRAEVLAAASEVVTAFGAHNVERYFASFAEDATFLFHNHDELITSRAEYEQVWRAWEKEGFKVLGCRSVEPRVTLIGPASAVFTHRVRTLLSGEERELTERETMVFTQDDDGRWLVVHEHLSVDPKESGSNQQ